MSINKNNRISVKMKSAKSNPMVHKFHSTPHLYQGQDEPDLLLEIYEYGEDSLEVKLINRNLPKQKSNLKKHIAMFILASGFYMWIHLNRYFQIPHVEIGLVTWLATIMWQASHLVDYEKFIFCYDFGLHLQIQRALSRSSTFIVDSNIHDIRINEVIENMDFRYLLIIRTKGKHFGASPIVPIFKVFKPSVDCLTLIYHRLNKVMLKDASTSQ